MSKFHSRSRSLKPGPGSGAGELRAAAHSRSRTVVKGGAGVEKKILSSDEIYDLYVEQMGYPPKKAQHLMAYSRRVGASPLALIVAQKVMEKRTAQEKAFSEERERQRKSDIKRRKAQEKEMRKSRQLVIEQKRHQRLSVVATRRALLLSGDLSGAAKLALGAQLSGRRIDPNEKREVKWLVKTLRKVKMSDLDEDNSGEVDRWELTKYLTSVGVNEDVCDYIFDDIDRDHGGTVDPEEWEEWRKHLSYKLMKKLLKRKKVDVDIESVFKELKSLDPYALDENGDGSIDLEELKHHFWPLGVPDKITTEVFRAIDVENRGVITPMEYLLWKDEMWLKKFETMMKKIVVYEEDVVDARERAAGSPVESSSDSDISFSDSARRRSFISAGLGRGGKKGKALIDFPLPKVVEEEESSYGSDEESSYETESESFEEKSDSEDTKARKALYRRMGRSATKLHVIGVDEVDEMEMAMFANRALHPTTLRSEVPISLVRPLHTHLVECGLLSGSSVRPLHNERLERAMLGKVRLRTGRRMLLDADSTLYEYGFVDSSGFLVVPYTKLPLLAFDLNVSLSAWRRREKEYLTKIRKALGFEGHCDLVLVSVNKHEMARKKQMREFICVTVLLRKWLAADWGVADASAIVDERLLVALQRKIQQWACKRLAHMFRSFQDMDWLVTLLKQLKYKQIDVDGSGDVDNSEFNEYFEDNSIEPLAPSVTKTLFDDLDADGDGNITAQEFEEWKEQFSIQRLLELFPLTAAQCVIFGRPPAELSLKLESIKEHFYESMQYCPKEFDIESVLYTHNATRARKVALRKKFSTSRIMFSTTPLLSPAHILFNCLVPQRHRQYSTFDEAGRYGQGHYLSTNLSYVLNEALKNTYPKAADIDSAMPEALSTEESQCFAVLVSVVHSGKCETVAEQMPGHVIGRRYNSRKVSSLCADFDDAAFGLPLAASKSEDKRLADVYVLKDEKKHVSLSFIVTLKRRRNCTVWLDRSGVQNVDRSYRGLTRQRLAIGSRVPDKIYACQHEGLVKALCRRKHAVDSDTEIYMIKLLEDDTVQAHFNKLVKHLVESIPSLGENHLRIALVADMRTKKHKWMVRIRGAHKGVSFKHKERTGPSAWIMKFVQVAKKKYYSSKLIVFSVRTLLPKSDASSAFSG